MERRMLSVFSTIAFLVEMRLAVFVPFFGLYVKNELGASYTQLGVILALMAGLNAFFQIVWGWASDRVAKRKQFLILGEVVPGAAFLLLPRISSIAFLAASLMIIQIFLSMATPTWRALIAEHSKPGKRGGLMGKITAFGGIGAIMGVYIVKDLIPHYGYAYLFYFCSFCMLMTAVVAVFAREPEGLEPSQQKLLSMEQVRTLRTEHRLFSEFTFLILLSMLATQLFEGFISLYIVSLGGSLQQVGYILMLRDGTETALMIPAGKLTDTFGRVKMLRISLIIYAAAVLLFASVPAWWYLFLAVAVESIGYSGYHVSSFAVLSSLTPREMRGTYMGFHSMITRVSALAPSLSGPVADRYGLRTLFFTSFVLGAFIAFYFVRWLHENREAIFRSEN